MHQRLSNGEFWKLHGENRKTNRDQDLRRRKLEAVDYACCVCGHDYMKKGISKWELHMDHKQYWDDKGLIFGRETPDDFRVCCPTHHLKGVRSDYAINLWRKDLLWLKVAGWFLRLPIRLLRFLFWR